MNIKETKIKYSSPANMPDYLSEKGITMHKVYTLGEIEEIISIEIIKTLFEPLNTTFEEVERKIIQSEIEQEQRNRQELEELKILKSQNKLELVEDKIETEETINTTKETKSKTNKNKTK